MAETISTKLLLSTTRPGPFTSGSAHSILSLGQRPLIGKIILQLSVPPSALLLMEPTLFGILSGSSARFGCLQHGMQSTDIEGAMQGMGSARHFVMPVQSL